MQRYGFASAPISNGGYMSISLYLKIIKISTLEMSVIKFLFQITRRYLLIPPHYQSWFLKVPRCPF